MYICTFEWKQHTLFRQYNIFVYLDSHVRLIWYNWITFSPSSVSSSSIICLSNICMGDSSLTFSDLVEKSWNEKKNYIFFYRTTFIKYNYFYPKLIGSEWLEWILKSPNPYLLFILDIIKSKVKRVMVIIYLTLLNTKRRWNSRSWLGIGTKMWWG